MTRRPLRWLPPVLLLGLLFLFLVEVPRQAIAVQSAPVVATPADVGLAWEGFSLSPADGGPQLEGWWMSAATPRAALVFVHGGGSSRTSDFVGSLELYAALVARGISVSTFDLRNHGNSGRDGLGLQFGRSEQHDVLAAIAWTRRRQPDLPIYLMGTSMGGATAIHAVHGGAEVDGLILFDPLLDTDDVFRQGGWVQTGLPPWLFGPSAWSAQQFFGLPSGEETALARARSLQVPVLLLQDPQDPVTRLPFAQQLADANPAVRLWLAPAVAEDDPRLAWKGRWGSHVAAFQLFPEAVLAQIESFIGALAR